MSCENKTLIWYLYLIQGITGKIYTGISPDPWERLVKHNSGRGAKATRAGRPWVIAYVEECGTKSQALKREIQVKKWPRRQKLDLIASGKHLSPEEGSP